MNHTSYLISMSYSYWCSHLNRRIHIPQSTNHFPYSVTLGTKGQLISHLYTRVPFLKPQIYYTGRLTLSHFRGLFNDHIRPIIVSQNIISPKGYFHLMDNSIFQRTYRTFPILFYKVKKNFSICQIFLKLFLWLL
jgi:hypothetical protein